MSHDMTHDFSHDFDIKVKLNLMDIVNRDMVNWHKEDDMKRENKVILVVSVVYLILNFSLYVLTYEREPFFLLYKLIAGVCFVGLMVVILKLKTKSSKNS